MKPLLIALCLWLSAASFAAQTKGQNLKPPSTNPTIALQKIVSTGLYPKGAMQDKVHRQVKKCLADGADPNTQTPGDKFSVLMFLAGDGDLEGVRDLLRRKVNLQQTSSNGMTALLYAALMGHKEVVTLLLEQGADVKNERDLSLLPLKGDSKQLSAEMMRLLQLPERRPFRFVRQVSTARVLLSLGADPAFRDAEEAGLAAYAFDTGLMEDLLAHGANPNVTTKQGQPALIHNAFCGRTDLALLLLKYGANPNAAEKDGFTALLFAAQKGDTALAKALLERGADPNCLSKSGWRPLALAASAGDPGVAAGRPAIVCLLLAHGAKVDSQDEEGWSALTRAVAVENVAEVKMLLEAGADVAVRNKDGQSLLQMVNQYQTYFPKGALRRTKLLKIAALLKQAGAKE